MHVTLRRRNIFTVAGLLVVAVLLWFVATMIGIVLLPLYAGAGVVDYVFDYLVDVSEYWWRVCRVAIVWFRRRQEQ